MSATSLTSPFGETRTRREKLEPGGGGGASGPGPPITAYVLPSPFVATSTAPGTVANVREPPLRSSSITPVPLSTTSKRSPGPVEIPRGLTRPLATGPPAAVAVTTTTAAMSPAAPKTGRRTSQALASTVRFMRTLPASDAAVVCVLFLLHCGEALLDNVRP